MLLLYFGSKTKVVKKKNGLLRLQYLFSSLPVRIKESQYFAWDNQMSRFICAGIKPRVKIKTLQCDKEKWTASATKS